MSGLPDRARAVIVGAGIVGNWVVYHLAEHGWKDMVLLDKGSLPNPGGSTEHSSAMTPVPEATTEFTTTTLESTRQYEELGTFMRSGGIEVARTHERLGEFRRRLGLAKAGGFEAELVSAANVQALVPYIDSTIILGGFYTPGTGVVDPVRAGTLLRERTQTAGVVTVSMLTEVIGIDVEGNRVAGVRTSKGSIKTDTVVICCGVWSPLIARMAGVSIPVVPGVHQLVTIGPVPAFAQLTGEINFPIVRDMDAKIYARQRGADLELGSTAHRPIIVTPEGIPSLAESPIAPAEFPFTKDDFDRAAARALELMPSIIGDERVGIRNAINGLISLSAEGLPILGESPGLSGFWSANRVDVKTAPAVALILAKWMTAKEPKISFHTFDIAKFHAYQLTSLHVNARAADLFKKSYDILHPFEEWTSNRNVRLSPMNLRERELGAVFTEAAGWELPMWYTSNERLLDEYGDRVMERSNTWDSGWWSPVINAEHLAMRDRVGIADIHSLAAFDICGRGALDYLQRLAVSQVDVPLGRVVYTWLLNEAGGIVSDVTVMRLGPAHFRVMMGVHRAMRDVKWLRDNLPVDCSVQIQDVTSGLCKVAVWGPRARDLVQSLTSDDLSNSAFPFSTARFVVLGGVPSLMSRLSWVGELGWEIYAPMEQGLRLWDTLWDGGQPYGVVPVGAGVSVSGRLEKNYRAHGSELGLDFDLVEAGLARATMKDANFIGKSAYIDQRSRRPAALLCILTVDDHSSSTGEKRYMLGLEPILTPEGQPLVDEKGRRSYVTSAGSGPSIGRHLLMAYLPPSSAVVDTKLAVEYFGERYPVTVAGVGSAPLFDPNNTRLRS